MAYTNKSFSERFFYTKAGNPFALALAVGYVVDALYVLEFLTSFELPPPLDKGGHWQFLTNLTFLVTIAYFSVSIIYHLFQWEALSTIKSYLDAISAAAEIVVSSVYWSLRIGCADLILQKGAEPPIYMDVTLHICPLVSILFDYFLFQDRWDISNPTGFAILAVATTGYWEWLHHLLGYEAPQPYPFLDVDVPKRAVVFGFVSGIAYVGFLLCKYVHPAGKDKSKKE